jgi:hypothetical protein
MAGILPDDPRARPTTEDLGIAETITEAFRGNHDGRSHGSPGGSSGGYIYIFPICVPVTDVGYVRHFCSGEVISRRFGTLIALDRGMQIMFTETVLSKMFSLRPK